LHGFEQTSFYMFTEKNSCPDSDVYFGVDLEDLSFNLITDIT